MPNPRTEEERQKRRIYERRRKERIKSNPILREELLRKDRERYARKKAAGLILSRSQMTPRSLRILRKKNKISVLAYQRKKRNVAAASNDSLNNKNQGDLASQSNIQENESVEPPSNIDENYGLLNLPNNSLDPRTLCNDKDTLNSNTPVINPRSSVARRRLRFYSQSSERILRSSSQNLRIGAIVANSSHYICTSTPQQTPPGSLQTTPSVDSINSAESTLCPNSPQSDSSIASVEFKRDFKVKFRKYQKTKSKQLTDLQKKLNEASKEKEMYRKKYDRLRKQYLNTTEREISKVQKKPILRTIIDPKQKRIRTTVIQFYEDDENSSLCPGKKDTVTKNGVKKQKRLMTDTLQNLHKKYLNSGYPPISYVTFSRMKPFWVTQPNLNARNTCLCEKHENMDLLTNSLKKNHIIKENTTSAVLSSICCDKDNVDCLQRTCPNCGSRYLDYQEFDNAVHVVYWAWEKKKGTYLKNGVEKTAFTVEKVRHFVKPLDLIKKFENDLKPFLKHCANIKNQSQAIKNLKQNMTEKDCVIHIDFSENYNSKYNSEIQSVHFGGSRKQFTLHTSVLYFKLDGWMTKTQAFCTVSTSVRHDAAAVWAHLIPILREIETTAPLVCNLYIVSDSPSAQYRNKKILYIMSQLTNYCPTMTHVVWNYCECGHGKGAPDGVGGLLKRTADKLVSYGNDIPDFDTLVKCLKSSIKGVKIETVEDYEVTEKDWLLPNNLKAFPGTMQVHQVVWTKESGNRLALRRQSCTKTECLNEAIRCPHGKHLGFHDLSTIFQIAPQKDNAVKNANSNVICRKMPSATANIGTKSKNLPIKKQNIKITENRVVQMPNTLILSTSKTTTTSTISGKKMAAQKPSTLSVKSNSLQIHKNTKNKAIVHEGTEALSPMPSTSQSTAASNTMRKKTQRQELTTSLLADYVDWNEAIPTYSFFENVNTSVFSEYEKSWNSENLKDVESVEGNKPNKKNREEDEKEDEEEDSDFDIF